MVGDDKNFGRSVSFPIPSAKATNKVPRIDGRGSTSLPCRFHPFISRLEDEIRSLRTWHSSESSLSGAWICEGLALLHRLHVSLLDDLLQHPQARDSLSCRPEWADRLLDDFLRFADAYSSFRSTIVSLKQEQSATQAAIRRKDGPRIASCLRSQRTAEKELMKIPVAIRVKVGKCAPVSDTAEAELVAIVREVVTVTAAVSEAVLAGIVVLSSSLFSPTKAHTVPMVRRLASFSKDTTKEEEEVDEEKWRRNALERLKALEECLGEVEAVIGRLFRSLINTRVFLLNVLTPL